MAISIGTAVELLLKDVIALQSFQLLPDNYRIETAMTLDGKGVAVDYLPQLTTVAGTAAIERLSKASELHLKKEEFELAFRVRNSAIHLGVASTQANRAAFKQMVLLIDSLFTHLGVEASARIEYWGGEEAEKFVRAIVDEAITEAKARYVQLLRRAKDDYQTLTKSLVEAGKAEVIKQFADVPPTMNSRSEEAISHLCPACENMGWVVYEIHRGIPTVEYLDEEFGSRQGDAFVEREGVARRFECGVCRLKLDRREYLIEAAVTLHIELEPDGATQDELDEYEAGLVDAHIDFMIDVARGK
ncbi:hypothetical protein QWI29_13480 [Mycolicibacterium neoaurum]|uniref:hypothetical protein n=1 Tax=Mycolicibacterium neoaurum TaxID=1795 RepID=UPI0026725531|nr:hypothetical protein [Mycolicibacterium neoaurum]MDO3401045.1 hypothetical protein [Mycolicibacterium neoaurum]